MFLWAPTNISLTLAQPDLPCATAPSVPLEPAMKAILSDMVLMNYDKTIENGNI
jgi:hypothetical protein